MRLKAFCLSVALLLPCLSARADSYAFTFSGGGQNAGQVSTTYGFRFVPTVDIFVTSLGFIDYGQNGLAAGHGVSIWDSNQVLLASTTVTTANSTLQGAVVNSSQFRYTAITPVLLLAGSTYTLGAFENGASDIWFSGGTNISATPSLVTVSSNGYYNTNGYMYPGNTINNTYAIGNFGAVAATAATPEPSSLALLSTGALGLLGFARKRFA